MYLSLNEKHNAVNYHAVREAVAAGAMTVIKEDAETNLAYLFTKDDWLCPIQLVRMCAQGFPRALVCCRLGTSCAGSLPVVVGLLVKAGLCNPRIAGSV